MSSPLRSSLTYFAFFPCCLAGKFGKKFGLGMPMAHHVDSQAHDVSAQTFGDSVMQRVYTTYSDLPVGEDALLSAGWTKQNSECDEYLGYAWTEASEGTTRRKPLILYTTQDGMPAGVGTIIRDTMPDSQVKWTTTNRLVEYSGSSTTWQIDVAFRSSDVCTEGAGHTGIGDVLIVNPGGDDTYEIPQSFQSPWVQGSCFDGMGTHAFLNTNDATAAMPWNSEDLFPVVVMYNDANEVNAIFFASTVSQITIPILSANWWEPVTLSNTNMCLNYCDADCGFSDNGDGEWSTMHIYFNDWTTVSCSDDLQCESEGSILVPGKRACCTSDVNVSGGTMVAAITTQRVLVILAIVLAVGLIGFFVYRRYRGRTGDARDVQERELTTAAS